MNQAVSTSVARRSTFLRKISPKTVCTELGVNLLTIGNTRPVPSQLLYYLYGITGKIKTGQTDKGEWMAFLGRFRAVSPDKTRVFESGTAFVPVLEDMIYSSMLQAQDPSTGGDDKAQITFAVAIGIKPAPADKPSATGYEYDVQRLIEQTAEGDPLTLLETEVTGRLALAGPADGTSPENGAAAATSTGKGSHAAQGHKGSHAGK